MYYDGQVFFLSDVIHGDMPKWAMPAHTKVGYDAVYENTDCETTIYLQVIKPIDFY